MTSIPFAALVEFIDGSGKRHFADPTVPARKVRQVVRDSYRLPQARQVPINLIRSLSGQRITRLQYQLKRLVQAIAGRMQTLRPLVCVITSSCRLACLSVRACHFTAALPCPLEQPGGPRAPYRRVGQKAVRRRCAALRVD
jgi:hypothetical protein